MSNTREKSLIGTRFEVYPSLPAPALRYHTPKTPTEISCSPEDTVYRRKPCLDRNKSPYISPDPTSNGGQDTVNLRKRSDFFCYRGYGIDFSRGMPYDQRP